MRDMKEKALAKLAAEYEKGKYGRAARIMKQFVRDTLEMFIRQDDEFAQAVAQGGTFEKCMEAVSKNVGEGIPDIDAYRRAVQFYFPGAVVQFEMKIQVNPHESGANGTPDDNANATDDNADTGEIKLNFDELFKWAGGGGA